MTFNFCNRCKELAIKFEIITPGDLKKVLRVAKESVAEGTLSVLEQETPFSTPFKEINIEGPWDDIVSYVFRCNTCGAKFTLSAETYHGSGGSWSPQKIGS